MEKKSTTSKEQQAMDRVREGDYDAALVLCPAPAQGADRSEEYLRQVGANEWSLKDLPIKQRLGDWCEEMRRPLSPEEAAKAWTITWSDVSNTVTDIGAWFGDLFFGFDLQDEILKGKMPKKMEEEKTGDGPDIEFYLASNNFNPEALRYQAAMLRAIRKRDRTSLRGLVRADRELSDRMYVNVCRQMSLQGSCMFAVAGDNGVYDYSC